MTAVTKLQTQNPNHENSHGDVKVTVHTLAMVTGRHVQPKILSGGSTGTQNLRVLYSLEFLMLHRTPSSHGGLN